ncbi:hypothetical protein C9374_005315 [Naegleria lovaniensis]|uniref:Mitochondrial fission process protein 1 n=1 Tax=Naegleria lovaniensis TaxID=51637 RepID=A0AA88GM24_NAELO|nr:uncharacterized protein C9374_005315 [Naegleria lovaniensis]KAG2382735.1 hypothetical protein C9374_005315 [Naegleria lovaniensis]
MSSNSSPQQETTSSLHQQQQPHDSSKSSKVEKVEAVEHVVEESPMRYLAYGARLRTLITAGARYLAYTSDVGEAFRPIVHPLIVKGAYAISWAYVLGDVGLQTYNEKQKNSPTSIILRTCTKTALFQSTASMLLPAVTIHQTVHWTAKLMLKFGAKSRVIPTAAGLAMLPLLPFMFDHPVEYVVDKLYDKFWPVDHHSYDSIHNKEKQH